MDVKMKFIEKILKKKKNTFDYINITIVDANGNKLLNIRKDGDKERTDDLKICNKLMRYERNSEDKELLQETAELSELISLEVRKQDDVSRKEYTFSEEDIAEISSLLDKSRQQRYFTAKLKTSNYICFNDCSGLLICRGNFNVADKTSQGDVVTKTVKECLQEIKDIDDPFPFQEKAPIIVAGAVSGMLIAAVGKTRSDSSIVDIVKEVRHELDTDN